MPLTVRNRSKSTTVFAKPGMTPVIWKGAGDLLGDDVQRVHDSLIDDPDFLRSCDVGVLEVVEATDPEIQSKLRRSAEEFQARHKRQVEAQDTVIDRRQDRDLVSQSCIGPGPNGSGQCGEQVMFRASERAERPPLCQGHSHLAHEFALHETGSPGEGAGERGRGPVKQEWVRVTVRR